jgi:hypothetical protein
MLTRYYFVDVISGRGKRPAQGSQGSARSVRGRGRGSAYNPPRSNIIHDNDSQPIEEEQHAEPLIGNNVNSFPFFLLFYRTLIAYMF